MSERRYQKLLKACFVTIVFLLTIVIILSAIVSNKNSSQQHGICTTKSCIRAASMILENIDTSVDPCENFYEFSCGTYLKTKRIPDDETRTDVVENLRDTLSYKIADLLAEPVKSNDILSIVKAKTLYKSCIDEARIEQIGDQRIANFLKNEFEGWPIIHLNANMNRFSALEKLVKLRLIDVVFFIDVSISSDPRDPEKSVIRIRQPFTLLSTDFYNDSNQFNSYKKLTLKVVEHLGAAVDLNKNFTDETERMLNLEREISKLQLDENSRHNSTYKNMTIAELQQKLPKFDWKKYIRNMFVGTDNANITENEVVLVDDWEYLDKAVDIFAKYSRNQALRKDFDNLLVWSFVKSQVNFMSKKMRDIKEEYDKVIKETTKPKSRSLYCSDYVLEGMEYAVGRLYVSNHFDSKSKTEATKMINNLHEEFKEILEEANWMDSESRKNAIEKAEALDIKIGYPDFTYNDTFVDEIYNDYWFDEHEFFENSVNIRKVDVKFTLNELRKPRERKTWQTGPAIVNAYYSPQSNQISFPAGILQMPFYDVSVPNYLNYGGIGTVIGHEITHGFDDRGRLHDKNGVYHPDGSKGLWTNKTVENYKKKIQCLIDQYSQYVSKQVNKSLNGHQTKSENIADNSGIKQSFRAYKKWARRNGPEQLLPGLNYTQKQLFFINFGQIWCGKYRDKSLVSRILNYEHPPGEFRIIGSTSNFDEFAKAFKCKPGQRNNPINKCSVY